MVAQQQDAVGRLPQHHLSRRVAWRVQGLEVVAAVVEGVPVEHALVPVTGGRSQHPGGVGVGQLAQQLHREALCGHQLVEFPPPGVDAGGLSRQALAVYVADEETAGGAEQLGGETGVVGVEVGQEDVRVSHVHAQLCQTGFQGRPTFLLPEAGVHQQVSVAADEVGVQVFQRVPRQGDGDAVEVGGDLGDHGGTSFLCVCSIIAHGGGV